MLRHMVWQHWDVTACGVAALGCYGMWCSSTVPLSVMHRLFYCILLFFPEHRGSSFLLNITACFLTYMLSRFMPSGVCEHIDWEIVVGISD